MPDDQNNNFGMPLKHAENFETVPNDSATFGTVQKPAEPFRTMPKPSERTENHIITVREAARMFEAAGVARTERSITNWCQLNRQAAGFNGTTTCVDAGLGLEDERNGRSMMELPRIGIFSACKGRLRQLRITLPKNICDNATYRNLEFVIVDYSSPDGLRDWLHTEMRDELANGKIRYVRVDNQKHFFPAHARNVGAVACEAEIICNVDADNFTRKHFAEFLAETFRSASKGIFLGPGRSGKGVDGRLAFWKSDFGVLGGYDEDFRYGYGWEDNGHPAGSLTIETSITGEPGARLWYLFDGTDSQLVSLHVELDYSNFGGIGTTHRLLAERNHELRSPTRSIAPRSSGRNNESYRQRGKQAICRDTKQKPSMSKLALPTNLFTFSSSSHGREQIKALLW